MTTLSNITIRTLNSGDVEAYRALRQRVLDIGDGKYFNTSYERENALDEQGWLDWCTEKEDHCIFGTFHNDKLIGVMMITRYGPAVAKLVEWEATWFDPDYRGHGLAKASYEAVEKWTIDNGYNQAIVFIHENNNRSSAIRIKNGFTYLITMHAEKWADGSIASEHVYIKNLRIPKSVSIIPCAKRQPSSSASKQRRINKCA